MHQLAVGFLFWLAEKSFSISLCHVIVLIWMKIVWGEQWYLSYLHNTRHSLMESSKGARTSKSTWSILEGFFWFTAFNKLVISLNCYIFCCILQLQFCNETSAFAFSSCSAISSYDIVTTHLLATWIPNLKILPLDCSNFPWQFSQSIFPCLQYSQVNVPPQTLNLKTYP